MRLMEVSDSPTDTSDKDNGFLEAFQRRLGESFWEGKRRKRCMEVAMMSAKTAL